MSARFEAFSTRFPYRQLRVAGIDWAYLDTGGDASPIIRNRRQDSHLGR